MTRKKTVAKFQIGDFPESAILLFKSIDLLGYAEDQVRPARNSPIPAATAKLTPEKRQELGGELLQHQIDLDCLLLKVLRAHQIPAQKGWDRLHELRSQIRATG